MDDTDRAILDLEQEWFRKAGAKQTRIRMLGLAPTHYYQRLARLIRDPEAVLEYPQLMARLGRLLDQRRGQRTPGRVA